MRQSPDKLGVRPWKRGLLIVVAGVITFFCGVSTSELRLLEVQNLGTNTRQLRWSSEAGKTYQLQRADALTNPTPWLPVVSIQATGTVATAIDPAGPGALQRFYRVVELTNPTNDVEPPAVAFADATMSVSTNGSPAIRLVFTATDNIGVSSVFVKEGSNTLGAATAAGGNHWSFLVAANLSMLQGRFFSAVATDFANNQAESASVGLTAIDPDYFTPLDALGNPRVDRPLAAVTTNQVGPFVYYPGGRPRPGAAVDLFLRFPDGATLQPSGGNTALQFVRGSAGFATNSPFEFVLPPNRTSGSPKQIIIGPLAFTNLADVFDLNPTDGIALRAFGQFPLTWLGGVLDDRGLRAAQFRPNIPKLPLPDWSDAFGDLLVEFARERVLRVPLSGQFTLPDGTADAAQLHVRPGAPLWLTMQANGHLGLNGPVEVRWPNGSSVRAELDFNDPEYCLAISVPSLRVQALSNLVDLLPDNPTLCLVGGQLDPATDCLESFARAYGHFSAAVAASASNAPPSAMPPPEFLNVFGEVLEAWGYSATAGAGQALPLDQIAELVADTGSQAASHRELPEVMAYREALYRAKAAVVIGGLVGSPTSLAGLDLRLAEAEAAALDRATALGGSLNLAQMKEVARSFVETEALRQQANLPPGPLATDALPNLFRSFAERLADTYGVQTNMFVPDANPKINTLNRFVAMETLRDGFDLLANAALAGIDLSATRLDELTGQLGVHLFQTVNATLNAAEATNDLPAFILAGQDLVELAAWVQAGTFPNVPALVSLDDGTALVSLGNRLNALLVIELDRPFGEKTLGRQAAEIRALLRVLRGVPGTVTFAFPPIQRTYDKLEIQMNLAVNPTALAAETNILNLLELVEAGTLHRELSGRVNLPQTVSWESNRLTQVVHRLGGLAESGRHWRELDQAVRLLINAANGAKLAGNSDLRRTYLLHAAILLESSRTVARALMQDAGGLFRLLDFALPGDLIIERPAGYACYNRESGNFHGAVRGQLRLPKYDLTLTVPNASFSSGGIFDLSAFGQLNFDGGQLAIPPRQPAHLRYTPERGLSLEGGARLNLDNGLRFDAAVSLLDPQYCFSLAARGLEFDLGNQLLLRRIVIQDHALQTLGSESLDALGDYLHALNGASETVLTAATNFPSVDETGFGRPPEFATPEINFNLSSLSAWSAEVIANTRAGLTNAQQGLQSVLDSLQRLNAEARVATNALSDERARLAALAARVELRRRMAQASNLAANQQLAAPTELTQLRETLIAGALDEAALAAGLVTPDLADRFAEAIETANVLLEVGALFQDLEISPPEPTLPADPCAAALHSQATPVQRATALGLCAARRQAARFGFDAVSGSITNTNTFNATSEFELYRAGRALAAMEGGLRDQGVDVMGEFLVFVDPILNRQRELLLAELLAGTSLARSFEIVKLIAENIDDLDGMSVVVDNNGLMAQIGTAMTARLANVTAEDVDAAKQQADAAFVRRQHQIRSDVGLILGRHRPVGLVMPGDSYQPDLLTQLDQFFRVVGLPVPPVIGNTMDDYVRFKVQELRARPFTYEFLTNRLGDAQNLASLIIGLTDWADTRLTNDFNVLTNLQFTITNFSFELTAAAEAQRAWWLLDRYQETLRKHAGVYGTNLNAALRLADQQARAASLAASMRIAGAFSNLVSNIVVRDDCIVPLPGDVEIASIFGKLCYDRVTGSLQGCFGGRLEFPEVNTNTFFEINNACLDSSGAYFISAATEFPLSYGRSSLAANLNVAGTPAGVATFAGNGTLTVSNGVAGNQVLSVDLSYNAAAHRLSFDATGSNLDLRIADDFVIFDAGFGFDLTLGSPEGAFRASGSAGMLARQTPLPTSLDRTNFHLVVDNLATEFTYSANAFSINLSNGTLRLPEFFAAGLCPTNPDQPSGPLVGLSPGSAVTVNIGAGDNPPVSFVGALDFRNIGFTVPGLTNLGVEVCSAQLQFPANTLPVLTNLQATLSLPLPQQTAIIDVTNGAWAVDGFPVGTLSLRSNLTLLDLSGFKFSLPGANDPTCGDGTSLTVGRDAQGAFFTLNGGALFEIPAAVLGDDAGGPLAFATCGDFSAGENRSPQLGLTALSFNSSAVRLGGTGGLKIENAQLALDGLQNLFNPTPQNPWRLTLGGAITVPNGPQIGVSHLRFVFTGALFPNIEPGTFSLATTNESLLPIPGLPFNVSAASLTFKNGGLGFPAILAPDNLRITLSASMGIPPGPEALVTGQVDDFGLELVNGLPKASLNGIGIGFEGLEFPPLSIGGQVYIGGLNALGEGSLDDIFFVGKVGGTFDDIGIRGLIAFNAHGLIGYCLDANAGPAGIPIDGGALGGFLLTGAAGGISFQNSNADPCDFASYYPLDAGGRPIPNDQLPPDLVTNRPGASQTWTEHSEHLTRDQERKQLVQDVETAARNYSVTNPPPPPPAGGTNPVVNVPTFPCPTGDCPPPTINILCQPHPDTNQFPGKVIVKFSSLDEARLNQFGITRAFIQGSGLTTAAQIAAAVSGLVRSNISLLIPRADPVIVTAPLATQLNQEIENSLNQFEATLNAIMADAVQGVLGNSDNVYDAIKAAAYGGVPCPDVTIKLTGTLSHAAVSTALSGTVGVVLSSSGSAGVVGSLNVMGVPVGRMEQFISITDARGNPNPSICGETVFALGPIDVGRVTMKMACDGCATEMLNSFGAMIACMSDTQARAVLARVKPSVTNLPVAQAIASLNDGEKMAYLGTLFSQPPVPGLYDCFLNSASNALLNFQPNFAYCGEVSPKLFGFTLSPALVSFNAGATRTNIAGSLTFSPSYIIQNALLCAQTIGTVCYPLFPGFDEATLGFALGIPDPAPLFLAGLSGGLSSPEALSGVLSNGFERFLSDATMTVGYEIAPLGLTLAAAQGRVVMPNLAAHPARPGHTYVPPENRGVPDLPARIDLLLQALTLDYLKNPLWKGDANDLFTIYPPGSPEGGALQGLSFNIDYFPHGGLLGAGRLSLPKIIADAPPAELGTLFSSTNVLEQLDAAATLITDYVLQTSEVGSMGFYVPAPNPPFFTDTNGQPLTAQALMNSINSFDGLAGSFASLYPTELAFFRGYLDGRLLGVPIAQATLEMVPAGPDSHFLARAQIPTNSWLKDFVASALLEFQMRGSPPQSIDRFFTNLQAQVLAAAASSDPQLRQQALVAAQNSIADALPKVSLDLQVNNFRVPDAITNVLAASASARIVAYSPRFNPAFVGSGPLADVTRNGSVAFQGQFNFANYVTIDNAELGVAVRPAGLPALSGVFDVPLLGVPGLALQNAHFAFSSDPAVGEPYLAANGAVNPIVFLNPLNSQPLLSIKNLTNASALIAADFSLDRAPSGPPLPGFAISPARIDMPMLGPGLTVRIHGATTNDPFAFSSTGPWAAQVSVAGQLSVRDLFNNEIARIGAVGSQFSAELSGTGMQFELLAITLPTNITIVAFPGTPNQQTFALSSGGVDNRLRISSDGTFLLEGGIAGNLDLSAFGFGSVAAGASFQITQNHLSISGSINGGALTNVNLPSVSGNLTVTTNGLSLSGSASVPAFQMGVFVVSGLNGGAMTAAITNGGLALASGAKLRILVPGYPTNDLFTLNSFLIAGNGNLNVTAQSGALNFPGHFNLTDGSFTLNRTNGVASLSIQSPTLTLFPGESYASTITAPFTNLFMESTGRFYADTGVRSFGLPATFGATGRLEIGFEPDARLPGLGVATNPINFGVVDYGSSSNRTLSVTNTGNAPLVATLSVSAPAGFSVTPFSFNLDPGQVLPVTVRFTPVAAGSSNVTLTVLHNAGPARTIALTGNGRPVPILRLSRTNLAFGNVRLPQTNFLTLRVDNLGLTNLVVTNRVLSGPFSSAPTNFTVLPGSNVLVTVQYFATNIGNHTGTLEFRGNDSAAARNVVLSGTTFNSLWYVQREGTETFTSVAMNITGKGFAVGWNGVVLNTLNGGHSWSSVAVPNAPDFNAAALAANGNDGVIAGLATPIWVTTNAGVSWVKLNLPFPTFPSSWFGVGFVAGTSRQILAGKDSFNGALVRVADTPLGSTYQGSAANIMPLRIHPLASVASASIGGSVRILAGGNNGYLITTNGGSTWTNVFYSAEIDDTLDGDDAMSIALQSSGLGLLVGDHGRIYRTQDGGLSFHPIYTNTSAGPYKSFVGVVFLSSTVAYAADRNGNVFRGTNSATTGPVSAWFLEETLGPLNGLVAAASKLWAVGENGAIYHRPVSPPATGILTFEPATLDYGFVPFNASRPRALTLFNRGPVPLTITNITVTNAVATEFALSATFPVTLLPGSNLVVNVFYNPSVSNALNGQLLIRSSDPDGPQLVQLAGRSAMAGWVLKPSLPNGETVVDLHLTSASIGYAATANAVFKTTDGGNTWQALPVAPSTPIRTLHFVDDNTGYIGGGRFSTILQAGTSYIMRTVNGGATWTTAFNSSAWTPVVNLSMNNATTGFAVTPRKTTTPTANGQVLRTSDGLLWTVTNAPVNPFDGRAVDTVGGSEVFLSSGNVLYRSADAGNTWAVVVNATAPINDVQFSLSSRGWVGSDNGSVWRTINGGDTAAEWSNLGVVIPESINRIHFASIQAAGWATPDENASQAAIYRSDTLGTSWTEELSQSPFAGPGNLKPTVVYSRVGTNGVAMGTGGSVRRYEHYTNQLAGIAVAPPVLELGEALVGTNVFRTFTLRNSGDAVLTVTDLLVDGLSRTNNGFRITNAIPFTLGINATRPIGVVAFNAAAGPTNATLSIISDGAAQTVDVLLRSSAVLPPQVVTFQTDPPGLTLRIDGTNVTAPVAYTLTDTASGPNLWAVNSPHTIEAVTPQDVNGQKFDFESWSPVEERVFTNTFAQVSATYVAHFVPSETAGGGGGFAALGVVKGGSLNGGNPIMMGVTPPPGITNGPYIRLSEAAISAPVLGNFNLSGAALLSANLMDISLVTGPLRLPANPAQGAVAEVTAGAWRFLRSNNAVSLSAQTPGLKLLGNAVTPPSALTFNYQPNGAFRGDFNLPQGWKVAPGLLEFGNSSLTLAYTNFVYLSSTGQVRALRKPDHNWAFTQNLNLQFRDGPFTNTLDLSGSLLQVLVPGTATEFLEVRGQSGSKLELRRSNNGVFTLELKTLTLDVMGRTFTTLSGTASTAGRLTLGAAPPAQPFQLGPFTWAPNANSFVDWNVKNGSLAFRLAGGTLASAGSIAGWQGSLEFPDVTFDSRGDFEQKITLPTFTFNGIALGLAEDTGDRYVTFKRQNGVLSLRLRDRQAFFDGFTQLGFDINSTGAVTGFFNGSFGVDFGWPLGYLHFGSVSMSYDSGSAPYQFQAQLRVVENDVRVKFGSGGANACHLICGSDGCAETLCISFP